jgi:CheY-like chemotaxis protein
MLNEYMQVILVEDDPAVRKDIKAALEARFSDLIVVHDLIDWPEAKEKIPTLLENSHLVLSDMNLKGSLDNPSDNKFLRTEFDGLRIFGLTRKHSSSIPIILYTGHALQQNALDQLGNPEGPVWVLKKTGELDIEACVDRLSIVAEGIIRSSSLEKRKAVYDLLVKGDKEALNLSVLDKGPCWKSVLGVISSRAGSLGNKAYITKAYAEVLAKFLPTQPFKIPLLCRMLKPGDYFWPPESEKYGINLPKNRIETSRSAWEELVHPSLYNYKGNEERWRKGWADAIRDAELELMGVRSSLLGETALMLEGCLNEAKTLVAASSRSESQLKEELHNYFMGPVKNVNAALRGDLQSGDRTWGEAIKKLWGREFNQIDILKDQFCAEWEHIFKGIGYICTSSNKHSNSRYGIRGSISNLESVGRWRLRFIITDEGPGIKEFAAIFTGASGVKPTENLDKNHKLRLAQGLLWGYCTWRVMTKRQTESAVRFYDVFGVDNEINPDDTQVIELAREIEGRASGTAHVLDFICPLPISQPGSQIEVGDETLDLR